MDKIILETVDDLDGLFKTLRKKLENGPVSVEFKKVVGSRTDQQRKALEVYCSIMAKLLTEDGQTQNSVIDLIKNGFELPITQEWVKIIFRKTGFDSYGKKSTSKLTTVEMIDTYKAVDAGFGQLVGIRADWPVKDWGAKQGDKR